MKKKLLVKSIIIIAFTLLIFSMQVQANVPTNANFEEIASKALVNLKLMMGDEQGNLNLENNVTRCEFVTLVNRMMTYDVDDSSLSVPFKDISPKHWAYNNIKTALKHSLINGYTDNTVRPDNYVSFVEANAVIIRALGYDSNINKKWPEGIIDKSKELGLDKNMKVPEDKLITRGEASVLIYNALTVNFIE
ncbi:MAG TPA: S-layer homology domain-containing protein [Clostridiaceae bacterium]|jgi:hypothetical protein|nr:S-layer homology domain-containing protein [Clostridiaceae bacterium]